MSFYDDLEKFGDAIALESQDSSLSYSQLTQLADRIAEAVPTGSFVFCAPHNCLPAAAGYLGFLRKRVVEALVNPELNTDLFQTLYECYRPQYIWGPQGFCKGKVIFSYDNYELIATPWVDDKPEMAPDLAILLTTSGSTGSPKLVRQTFTNIDSNTQSIAEYLKIVPGDRAITTLPLSYTFGLSILQSHLLVGARLIMTEHTILEKSFWQLLREKQATTFGGVPYTYEMLKRLRFLKMDLPRMKYITQAGGRLGPEMHLEFAEGLREKGQALIVMYGATEATARMSYVPAEKTIEKAGSIGIAIPGGRFELMDVDGSLITDSQKVGELVYYGANVTPGYAESRQDLAKADERHGRLETGDMARRDDDGYYYVVGRKKRFLKLYGNRVNLMEIEALLSHEGYETACVGEDDHMRIYTTSQALEQIKEFVAGVTGINHAAFTVFHIDSIPRNDSGKVLYSELQ